METEISTQTRQTLPTETTAYVLGAICILCRRFLLTQTFPLLFLITTILQFLVFFWVVSPIRRLLTPNHPRPGIYFTSPITMTRWRPLQSIQVPRTSLRSTVPPPLLWRRLAFTMNLYKTAITTNYTCRHIRNQGLQKKAFARKSRDISHSKVTENSYSSQKRVLVENFVGPSYRSLVPLSSFFLFIF